MVLTELLEIIRNGESSGVEFKRDDINPEQLSRELVAFSNYRGGKVLLGVEDDGAISGTVREKKILEEWVMNVCRDKIRPEIIPYFEYFHEVEPGKDIAVVEVAPGWTVHHSWHKNKREYYIRVGTQSRDATPDELERLFQQRGSLRAELRPITGSTMHDLDIRRLRDYFQRIRQQDFPNFESEKEIEKEKAFSDLRMLLLNTELLVENDGMSSATVAAVLLFGKNPNRFLAHSGIDAFAFTGKEKDYNRKDTATIRGPLVYLGGTGGVVEKGVMEMTVDFIKKNMGISSRIVDGARRLDIPDYPDEVIREVLVNALVHRDYLLSATAIEVSLYDDRLEVVSPGRLPNGITPDRMRAGCRAARNQMLKDVLRDYNYMEHMGLGVPRKIVKGMKDHNGTIPDLIDDGERFIVRLWK